MADAQWWIKGIVVLPTILWATGWGWVLWLHKQSRISPLQMLLDSAWISLVIAWINISLIREIGVGQHASVEWILLGISLLWTIGGLYLGRNNLVLSPLPPRERTGMYAIFAAILLVVFWKAPDIQRPLDGYWYLEGADDPRHTYVPLLPAKNWQSKELVGWPEAGAQRLVPNSSNPDLIANGRANGRVTLAVRGPVGSYIEAKGIRNEVAQSMAESEEEGPVRRYLDSGVAAISIWADMQPGEYLGLNVKGDEVYLIPSSDAVWALHATGALRYTFYYQILNQVENQVWAEEILEDRRFTWNQPPGWSPILALSNIMITPDLNGAACLFLSVITLVGLCSLRLTSLIAPRAHNLAWYIPAVLVMVHALLMLEPASHNFPDSLYTVALLSVLIGLQMRDQKRFAIMGVLSQALRWPGAILATAFALLSYANHKHPIKEYLQYLWLGVGVGIIVTGLAVLSGDAEDVLFILYFETFPEHWHNNYSLGDLLSRMPNFYKKWIMYTGGMLVLTLPFLWGKDIEARKSLRTILGGAFGYSVILATIDHDPSHYFLPLIAITGPSFVAASTCLQQGLQQRIFLSVGLLGTVIYLWTGIV
jgi:hypothetical protein